MKEEDVITCPFAKVQPIVRGKWTSLIIHYLSEGTLRFGEIHRKMPMVKQSNLTRELRTLERYGLIRREVYGEVPPKVEYSLTDLGQKYLSVLNAFAAFADEYQRQNSPSDLD